MNKQQTALVTGAAGGLGKGMAHELGRRGYTVILLDRQVEALESLYDELVEAGAPEPAIYPLNLEGANPKDYLQLADTLDENFAGLDLLFHAAAATPGLKPMEQIKPDDWMSLLQINLNGPVWLTQALLALLADRKGGIVFTLEDLSRVQKAYWGAYGVAKHGLAAFQHMLAEELENAGVRVYGLDPGPMRTPIRAEVWVGEDPNDLPDPMEVAREVARRILDQPPASGSRISLRDSKA